MFRWFLPASLMFLLGLAKNDGDAPARSTTPGRPSPEGPAAAT